MSRHFRRLPGGYDFSFDIRAERIAIRILHRNAAEGVVATLSGPRAEMTSLGLLRAALRRPFGGLRTIALIYWQALRLKLKGARYRSRPAPPEIRGDLMLFLTRAVKRDFLDTCARITTGSLRLHTPEGEIHDFGHGSPAAEMQIHDWAVVTAIGARGDIGLGETYVAGLWDTPSIATLGEVALRNYDQFRDHAFAGFWSTLKLRVVNRLFRNNSPRGAARNIRAHYDVGNEFYQLWLDEGMTYSSAMFAEGDTDLARAQNRKYDRILDRLDGAERMPGDRLWLGRLCRTRRRHRPPGHRPDHLAQPEGLCRCPAGRPRRNPACRIIAPAPGHSTASSRSK